MSKLLAIGINYTGTSNELKGCVNDVKDISDLYEKLYDVKDIMMLADNGLNISPTKQNILNGINWLVSNNKPNTQLFFHYSGHGSQVIDRNGDENDNKDECVIALDGTITDDELRIKLVDCVKDCSLFCVFDCCSSGTILDLDSKKSCLCFPSKIICISGCLDSQTSADTYINNKYCGALTHCLITCLQLNNNPEILVLHDSISRMLSKFKFTQTCTLSVTNSVDVSKKLF